jgi:hypothetical protein
MEVLKIIMKSSLILSILLIFIGCSKGKQTSEEQKVKEVVKFVSNNLFEKDKNTDYNKLANSFTKSSYLGFDELMCMGMKDKFEKKCNDVSRIEDKGKNNITEKDYLFAKKLFVELLKNYPYKETPPQGIKSIKNLQINGDTAIVVYINKENAKRIVFLKKVNGQWKIDLDKTIDIYIKETAS